MSRALFTRAVVAALAIAFAGCGRDWESFDVHSGSGGNAGADGGGGSGNIGGGECFPGSKLCPDPNNPAELLCLTADDPEYGCSQSTACSPCVVPHATSKCTSGACAVDQCNSGWADCDNNDINGCEINTNADIFSCGNCGVKCEPPANASATCSGGSCGFSCISGFHNCGNACKANNDPTACGSGCTFCQGPAAGNGTPTCSAGACGITCFAPTTLQCNSSCYDPSNDKNNCGGCDAVCTAPTHGVSFCVSSVCSFTCETGYYKCTNKCNIVPCS